LDHTGAAVAIIVAILWGILVFRHRQYFSSLFALMAGSGLRIGEVSGLEIEDLNLAAELIRVRRGIWKGRAITPKMKRGKRTVFIEPTLVRISLHISREELREECFKH
jgi:integrase